MYVKHTENTITALKISTTSSEKNLVNNRKLKFVGYTIP